MEYTEGLIYHDYAQDVLFLVEYSVPFHYLNSANLLAVGPQGIRFDVKFKLRKFIISFESVHRKLLPFSGGHKQGALL